MKNRTFSVTTIITAFICLATILGYLGKVYWIFDLFAHFRLQYTVILLIMILAFFLYKKQNLAAVAVLFLIPNLYETGSIFFGGNKKEDLKKYLKISSINLLSTNGNEQAVLDLIQSQDPDILILLELNERWEKDLATAIETYPYQKIIPRTSFGMAMLSKVEVQNTTELNLSPAGIPSLLATILFDHQQIQIMAIHPVPPVGQQAFEYRNAQFASIIAMKQVLHENLIIIGDFNSTPYSPYFKQLTNELNLLDSRKGFGVLATWPTWFPPLKIPIDHCLVSPSIFIKNRAVGEPIGSDHLPIYLEVGFE